MSLMRRSCLIAAIVTAALTGCRTVPVIPPPAPPPAARPPALQRTFGTAVIGNAGDLDFSYKTVRLAVDPTPGELGGLAPSLDFLLLTGSGRPYLWPAGVRRDLKILAPATEAQAARQAGFVNAKALEAGQRLMLSKDGAFLFVSAVSSANTGWGGRVNGYFLEFDNGRNVFVSGDVVDLAPFRSFVYDLRDDGKQVHLAFIDAGAASAGARRRLDESAAADMVSLIQPQVAVIVDRGGLDSAKLKEAIAAQIVDGGWYVASPSESVPF